MGHQVTIQPELGGQVHHELGYRTHQVIQWNMLSNGNSIQLIGPEQILDGKGNSSQWAELKGSSDGHRVCLEGEMARCMIDSWL